MQAPLNILWKMLIGAMFFVAFFWVGAILLSSIPFAVPQLLVTIISILVVAWVAWWVFSDIIGSTPPGTR